MPFIRWKKFICFVKIVLHQFPEVICRRPLGIQHNFNRRKSGWRVVDSQYCLMVYFFTHGGSWLPFVVLLQRGWSLAWSVPSCSYSSSWFWLLTLLMHGTRSGLANMRILSQNPGWLVRQLYELFRISFISCLCHYLSQCMDCNFLSTWKCKLCLQFFIIFIDWIENRIWVWWIKCVLSDMYCWSVHHC